jgi:arabinose-5-phosphate isomerase
MPMGLVENGRRIIEMEAEALHSVAENLGEEFEEAIRLLQNCTGRVIVTGVGKAGLIGQKVSATLASTGIASYWMHAVEARHGDLGRVLPNDVVLAMSNSGETEVVQLLVPLKKLDTPIIAITGDTGSTLARYSDLVLSIGKIEEACPLGLAPSCTTTAMLAMGDALALTLFDIRNLTKEDYAFYHPGGELGRKLITVQEAMRIGERNPVASQEVTVQEAIETMSTEGSPGAVSLVDGRQKLVGFFTDGDIRRLLRQTGPQVLDQPVREVMTRDPLTVSTTDLAAEAYRIMRDKRIDNLPVVNEDGVPVGIIDVQDWLDVERGVDSPAEA